MPYRRFPFICRDRKKIDGRYVRPAQFIAFTFPLNLTGQPAANVPAGWTEEGLPVGLQIVGRHLEDWMVLRASANYEAAAPWRDRFSYDVDETGPVGRDLSSGDEKQFVSGTCESGEAGNPGTLLMKKGRVWCRTSGARPACGHTTQPFRAGLTSSGWPSGPR